MWLFYFDYLNSSKNLLEWGLHNLYAIKLSEKKAIDVPPRGCT